MTRKEHYEEACLAVDHQIGLTTSISEEEAIPMAMGFVSGLLKELRISSGMDPLDEPFDKSFWQAAWNEALEYERANGVAGQ